MASTRPHHLPMPNPPRREVIPPHPHAVDPRASPTTSPARSAAGGRTPSTRSTSSPRPTAASSPATTSGTFAPGHVSIMGPNLPHDWVSDLDAGPGGRRPRRRHPVHRRVGPRCMEAHARAAARSTRCSSSPSRGLVFSGATAWRAAETILAVVHSRRRGAARAPVQAAHPLRPRPARTSARSSRASGWAGPPTANSPGGRRGGAGLHLRATSPATSGSRPRPSSPTCRSRPSPSTSRAPRA